MMMIIREKPAEPQHNVSISNAPVCSLVRRETAWGVGVRRRRRCHYRCYWIIMKKITQFLRFVLLTTKSSRYDDILSIFSRALAANARNATPAFSSLGIDEIRNVLRGGWAAEFTARGSRIGVLDVSVQRHPPSPLDAVSAVCISSPLSARPISHSRNVPQLLVRRLWCTSWRRPPPERKMKPNDKLANPNTLKISHTKDIHLITKNTMCIKTWPPIEGLRFKILSTGPPTTPPSRRTSHTTNVWKIEMTTNTRTEFHEIIQ